MKVHPIAAEVAREAVIVLGGAVLAALIIDLFPGVKAWIKEKWQS